MSISISQDSLQQFWLWRARGNPVSYKHVSVEYRWFEPVQIRREGTSWGDDSVLNLVHAQRVELGLFGNCHVIYANASLLTLEQERVRKKILLMPWIQLSKHLKRARTRLSWHRSLSLIQNRRKTRWCCHTLVRQRSVLSFIDVLKSMWSK